MCNIHIIGHCIIPIAGYVFIVQSVYYISDIRVQTIRLALKLSDVLDIRVQLVPFEDSVFCYFTHQNRYLSSLLLQPDFRRLRDIGHFWYMLQMPKASYGHAQTKSFGGTPTKQLKFIGHAPWVHVSSEVSAFYCGNSARMKVPLSSLFAHPMAGWFGPVAN